MTSPCSVLRIPVCCRRSGRGPVSGFSAATPGKPRCGPENIEAVLRMRADKVEFLGAEATFLAEDRIVDADLADIVEQSGKAVFVDFALAAPELACDIHHQRRDRDRMQMSVLVLLLEADRLDQRARAMPCGGHDVADEFLESTQFDGAPRTDPRESIAHDPKRARHQLPGLRLRVIACPRTGPGGYPTLARIASPGTTMGSCVLRADLAYLRCARRDRRGRCACRANAALVIDHDIRNVCRLQSREMLGLDREPGEPERMVEPTSPESPHEHADPDILRRNPVFHSVRSRSRSARITPPMPPRLSR